MSSSDLDSACGEGKLRLMCMHGFMQSGDSFRTRIGSMRKALKSRAALSFADATFAAGDVLSEAQVAEFGGTAQGRTWIQWREAAPGTRPSQSTEYVDFERTYAHMVACLREHRPDGVLGFSQGATAAALLMARLAARRAEGEDLDVQPPRFALLCAGFLPRDEACASLLRSARLAVPTLFILGDADALVPPARTLDLAATFDPAAVALLRHPGAHMVPTCSGDVKRQITEFLDQFKPTAAADGRLEDEGARGDLGGSGSGAPGSGQAAAADAAAGGTAAGVAAAL